MMFPSWFLALHRAAPWFKVYQKNPHFLALPKNNCKKNPTGVSDGVKALLLSHGHHEETGSSLSGLRGRWWVICWG
jgi:mRNA degradation ribonuclease J1/J2